MNIHPTALVDSSAKIADGVKIGPYCIIGGEVELGEGTELVSHVVLSGKTKIGKNNKLYSFVSLGQIPQDLKFDGEVTELVIGDGNSIREYVTMSLGTKHGGGRTEIGNNNLFMVSSHVGHDTKIGNHCVIANCVALAGHVTVDDYAILGGLSAVHQFCRIGRHSIIGGGSPVVRDVIPFGMATGNRAKLDGLNLVGLKRRGFSKDIVRTLLKSYKEIFEQSEMPILEKAKELAIKYPDVAELSEWAKFIESSERGVCRSTEE